MMLKSASLVGTRSCARESAHSSQQLLVENARGPAKAAGSYLADADGYLKHGSFAAAYNSYSLAIKEDASAAEAVVADAVIRFKAEASKAAEAGDHVLSSALYFFAGDLETDPAISSSLLKECEKEGISGANYESVFLASSNLFKRSGANDPVLLARTLFFACLANRRPEDLERSALETMQANKMLASTLLYYAARKGIIFPDVESNVRSWLPDMSNEGFAEFKLWLGQQSARMLLETDFFKLLSEFPYECHTLVAWKLFPFKQLVKALRSSPLEMLAISSGSPPFGRDDNSYLAYEYGKYLWRLKNISRLPDNPESFLAFDEFKGISQRRTRSGFDSDELRIFGFEVSNAADALASVVRRFGGAEIVGNMRGGHCYGSPVYARLAERFGDSVRYSVARIGSTEIADIYKSLVKGSGSLEKGCFVRPELFESSALDRAIKERMPLILLDVTSAVRRLPAAADGFKMWVAAYDLLFFRNSRLWFDKEALVRRVVGLSGLERRFVEAIMQNVSDGSSRLVSGFMRAIKDSRINGPFKVYTIDLDSGYPLPDFDSSSIPLVLTQLSLDQGNIQAEVLGSRTTHSKAHFDDHECKGQEIGITVRFNRFGHRLSTDLEDALDAVRSIHSDP